MSAVWPGPGLDGLSLLQAANRSASIRAGASTSEMATHMAGTLVTTVIWKLCWRWYLGTWVYFHVGLSKDSLHSSQVRIALTPNTLQNSCAIAVSGSCLRFRITLYHVQMEMKLLESCFWSVVPLDLNIWKLQSQVVSSSHVLNI